MAEVFKGFKDSAKNLANIFGWHTKRKIVVIESDDWGSERMPSKEIYYYLLRKGIRVDECPYSKYDSLASEGDLTELFDVLTNYVDFKGNHPVFTANVNVANPDFAKIKEYQFREYYFHTLPFTFSTYPEHAKSLNLWHEGFNKNIFIPQYHGREHLAPHLWLTELTNNHLTLNLAFDVGVYGLSRKTATDIKQMHLASFIYRNNEEKQYVDNSMRNGVEIFNEIIGYYPEAIIAPVHFWNKELELSMQKIGIKYIQGVRFQKEYHHSRDIQYQNKFHYIGQKNIYNQTYLVRNCIFEPTQNIVPDPINTCLKQIETAFRYNKPAIIASHRLNYVGFIDRKNRDKNLPKLRLLLKSIIQKWPEVEFMDSVSLGRIINKI